MSDQPTNNPQGDNGIPADAPEWVSDPKRAYAEIQRLRAEAGDNRVQAKRLSDQYEQVSKTLESLVARIGGNDADKAADDPIKALVNRVDGLQQQLESERKRADDARKNSLKMRVANEFGLSAELADRLRGDNEDELRQDAETLSALIPKNEPSRTTTGVPDGRAPRNTEEDMRQRLFNKRSAGRQSGNGRISNW